MPSQRRPSPPAPRCVGAVAAGVPQGVGLGVITRVQAEGVAATRRASGGVWEREGRPPYVPAFRLSASRATYIMNRDVYEVYS